MNAVLQQLAKLDLSPLVPKKYRAKAKAIGTAIVGVVAVAVELTLINVPTGAIITTAVTDLVAVVQVHQTTNAK